MAEQLVDDIVEVEQCLQVGKLYPNSSLKTAAIESGY